MRRDRIEPRGALLERGVEQVLAVQVQDVEEEGHDALRRRRRRRSAKRCPGTPPARARPSTAPRRRAPPAGPASARTASTIPGSACVMLVEVPRVDADLVAAAMDLDPDPVELPLDGRALEAPDRVRHALGRRGEHRKDRPEELEADTSRSPSSPSAIASSAVRVRSPESISARRASSPETPAAFAIASTISPESAPCRSSPVRRRLTKSPPARSRGRAARRGSRFRLAAEPLPVAASIAGDRAVEVLDRERSARRRARTRRRRPSRSRRRPVPGGARRRGSRRRSEPRSARAARAARRGSRPSGSARSWPPPPARRRRRRRAGSSRPESCPQRARAATGGLSPSCDHSLDSVPRRA